jgi:hypothetical protein
MIHCLLLPILVIFGFDAFYLMIDQEWIELTIIGLSLFLGLFAFIGGFVKHRQHFIPVLFIAGFLLVLNGEGLANEQMGLALSLLGASIIVYAHFQNLKWKRNASFN